MTSHFTKTGGNALGITVADGPLSRVCSKISSSCPRLANTISALVLNIVFSWFSAADDTSVLAAARNTFNRSNAMAYCQVLGFPFLYQNFAAIEQPVFPSYGAEKSAKLPAASRKYDPTGVW